MEIRIENQTCEVCGRNISAFKRSAFRQLYKCPNCEKMVCCECLFEHKCGRRLCTECIASRLGWRRATSRYGPDGKAWNYKFEVWEHPWGAPACGVCGKTNRWYQIADLIAIRL